MAPIPAQPVERGPAWLGGLEPQQTPFCAQQGTWTLLRTALLLQGFAGIPGVLSQDGERENHSSSKAWDSTEPQPERAKLQEYSVTVPYRHKKLEVLLQTAPHTPIRPGTSWEDRKNTPEPELVSPHTDPAQIPVLRFFATQRTQPTARDSSMGDGHRACRGPAGWPQNRENTEIKAPLGCAASPRHRSDPTKALPGSLQRGADTLGSYTG